MRRIVKSLTTCTAAGMLLAAGANGTVCQSRQDGQCLPRKSKYGGAARNTGDEPDTQCRAWSFETRTTCNAGHNHFRERGPRKVSSAAQAQRMTSPACPPGLGEGGKGHFSWITGDSHGSNQFRPPPAAGRGIRIFRPETQCGVAGGEGFQSAPSARCGAPARLSAAAEEDGGAPAALRQPERAVPHQHARGSLAAQRRTQICGPCDPRNDQCGRLLRLESVPLSRRRRNDPRPFHRLRLAV